MIKSTGIVRRVDELGRVVLPIELRRTLYIAERDPLEIFVEGDRIILKKYDQACIFCGGSNNVHIYREKNICGDCIEDMTQVS